MKSVDVDMARDAGREVQNAVCGTVHADEHLSLLSCCPFQWKPRRAATARWQADTPHKRPSRTRETDPTSLVDDICNCRGRHTFGEAAPWEPDIERAGW